MFGKQTEKRKTNLKRKSMKTEEIALSRVSENEANPREISQANFQKLVQSIIVFPRMLTLRPIVIDETFHALGGNMRLKALQHIVTMSEDSIQMKLDAEQRLTDEEQALLMEYWQEWQKKPVVTVVSASDLTDTQKQEFMIKDNLSFGNWDFNDLANRWDSDKLENWGVVCFNNGDMRGLFDKTDKSATNEEKAPKNENLAKITIKIPKELAEAKDEIISGLQELLASYDGVVIS